MQGNGWISRKTNQKILQNKQLKLILIKCNPPAIDMEMVEGQILNPSPCHPWRPGWPQACDKYHY